jgi:predicted phosphodiesterase
MLPPNVPGGITGWALAPGRAYAHRAEERLERDRHVLAHVSDVAVREVERPQVGVREVLRQQAQPREHRRPTPALGVDVEDLDRQRVARLRAGDRDRPRERIDPVPVHRGDHARVRVGPDLVVADVARPDHDRVAGVDAEHRLVARVPCEVDPFVRQVMRARHPTTSRLAKEAERYVSVAGRAAGTQSRTHGTSIAGVNVLALYDIHGNIDALEAVLTDPRATDADVVVVGGDAVPGPFARATLARLEALSVPVRWLRGNGEREVAEAVGGSAPADDDLVGRTAAIAASELGDEQARALGELPLTLEVDGILFCHASPRRDDEMLTRLSPPERWSDAVGAVDAALVVGGHTHQQDDRVVGSVRFVNAGSVGLPYEGDGAARWLWIADGVPELRDTAYDAAGAGARILAAGWPDERSIGAALVEPVEPVVVTRIFEGLAG